MANNKDFKVKNGIQPTVYHEGVGTVVSGSVTVGYDLAGASYDNVDSPSLSTEIGQGQGFFFKPDGSTLYASDQSNAYQYTLSSAWDLSTISYASKSLSLSSASDPNNIFFKTDGTKFYVVSKNDSYILEYDVSTAWDISTAPSSYSRRYLVSSQMSNPTGVFFKSDGTKMYVLSNSSDTVYQYSLSTAWNVTTSSYDSKSFSVTSQAPNPRSIQLNNDGTGLFVSCTSNDAVFQYTLSTAYDISTATYSGYTLDVSSQNGFPFSIGFKSDGLKIYMFGATSDKVHQYSSTVLTTNTLDLSTGSVFEVTPTSDIQVNLSNPAASGTVSQATLLLEGAATDTHALDSTTFEKTLDVSSQDTAPTDLFIADNGTKLYLVGEQTDDIYQYNLSTEWDVSTASYQTNYAIPSGNGTNPTGIFVKPDGTKLYVSMENTEDITQYSMSTAFDLSTISDDAKVYTIPSGAGSTTRSVFFKSDGTKLYTTYDSTGTVYQHSLSTAWDISTASYDSVSFIADPDNTYNNLKGLSVDSTGTNFYLLDSDYDEVFKYTLTTAWDISTASFAQRVDISGKETSGQGVFVKPDGTKMYILGTASDSVHQYGIAPPATITYPSTLEFSGGTAPTSPAIGETDVITISTTDGGTSYQAVQAIDGAK